MNKLQFFILKIGFFSTVKFYIINTMDLDPELDLVPDPHWNQYKSTTLLSTVVRHVTGNDEDYLRKIPRVVVQKSALL